MQDQQINELTINNVVYVRKDSISGTTQPVLKDYVIVRTTAAGVFTGNLADSSLREGWAKMTNARRLWYWDGAASLSQLAIDGVSKPQNCKFPEAVKEITLIGVIEIIPCTEKAMLSIAGVRVWKA